MLSISKICNILSSCEYQIGILNLGKRYPFFILIYFFASQKHQHEEIDCQMMLQNIAVECNSIYKIFNDTNISFCLYTTFIVAKHTFSTILYYILPKVIVLIIECYVFYRPENNRYLWQSNHDNDQNDIISFRLRFPSSSLTD